MDFDLVSETGRIVQDICLVDAAYASVLDSLVGKLVRKIVEADQSYRDELQYFCVGCLAAMQNDTTQLPDIMRSAMATHLHDNDRSSNGEDRFVAQAEADAMSISRDGEDRFAVQAEAELMSSSSDGEDIVLPVHGKGRGLGKGQGKAKGKAQGKALVRGNVTAKGKSQGKAPARGKGQGRVQVMGKGKGQGGKGARGNDRGKGNGARGK